MVAYNEEARLEECLVDARPHVDEIVVVDQMSTDATPEIAERLADVFIRDVHHGHAEPSRELAASRSSGDWILILDADEKMSDLLKAELRALVEGVPDGYWINKANFVGGAPSSTVHHYRLVRRSRVRFDPGPHGGATAVSDNVGSFDRIGIIHEKTVAEQVFDDARYERLALEEGATTSSKRNWLAHNHTLREQRARRRRTDLEALVPAGTGRAAVWGDAHVELPGYVVERLEDDDGGGAGGFDAVVLALEGDDPLALVERFAHRLRPGGVLVGTVPAARNRRRLEEAVAAVLSEGAPLPPRPVGTTRRALLDGLDAAGLDARWLTLVRDGWLNPVALRADGSDAVVESEDFLLKRVKAEAAEELTAQEIIFAAVRPGNTSTPECSIIVAVAPGSVPRAVIEELGNVASFELIVVGDEGSSVLVVDPDTSLAGRWNAGARAASGTLLAFLSADAVPLPGWLDAVIEAHRTRPDTGAVGSKIMGADGSIEHAGLVVGPDRIPYRLYQGEPANAACVNRPRIMPAVMSVGMVTARARFVEVGGFDETLGDDLSDADYCLRLRARGHPILYAPVATLRSSPRSMPRTRAAFRRSAREFATRWSGTSVRSDDVVCGADGRDGNQQFRCSWPLPRPSGGPRGGGGGLPSVAWTSYFYEFGGYTEEAMAAVEALDQAGLHVVANAMGWDKRGTAMPARMADRLAAQVERDLPDNFVHVAHMGADQFKRHPGARRNIGRTMFETDGLPTDWRDRCNEMDEIWVPSEHNLRTFAAAGVAVSKLHKVPETFDTELFDPGVAPLKVEGLDGFVFLSLFSWIDRKAWDVLLRAWFEEFGASDDATLLLKTDTQHAAGTDCRREVLSFVRHRLQRDPNKGAPVVVLDRILEATDVPRLYRAADAFVLPSHGEGWGRPYMEAMAMGLPTIATRWSGNLEFMNDDNSYLVGYELVDVPGDTWRRGHRWAEPSVPDLRRALRRIYEHRGEAAATGRRARSDVLVSCRPELLAEAVRDRLESFGRHPRPVALPDRTVRASASDDGRRRSANNGRRLTACVVVQDDAAYLPQCLASVRGIADHTVVVDAGASEDLAAVRNEALDGATGGWVLMLDATQTLDPASTRFVRELVDQDRFVGYTAHELHQFGLDGAVSSIERRVPVLFPRHPDLRYTGWVDEQLLAQRSDLEFRLAPSPVVLLQHDYRRDRYDPITRARHHLPALERSVRETPGDPFHRYNLGSALVLLGLHEEAETALRQAIKLAPRGATWGPSALASLSQAVAAQGRNDQAVKLCKTATKRAPAWAEGWSMLGRALADAGRPHEALDAYQRAIDCAVDSWPGGDPQDGAWQVRAGMSHIHLALGEYAEAAECLRGAVAQNPGDASLRVLLARAYDSLGQPELARPHLERAANVTRAGPEAFIGLSDFLTNKAEAALIRGLAENAENRALLDHIERLRAARAMG